MAQIYVLGAGLAGCCAALELAEAGQAVTLLDAALRPMLGTSRHNEGKLHYGYVYAADTTLQTHRKMIAGSLRFTDILARLTRTPATMQYYSAPFTYIVPEDSQRTVAELTDYVAAVDKTLAEESAALGLPAPCPSRALDPATLDKKYSDRVIAGFSTPEIAVDPARVSDIVTAAIYAHPLITFCGGCKVSDVEHHKSGYRLTVARAGQIEGHTPDAVINATWENRGHLDAMVGLEPRWRWSLRWKATLTIDARPAPFAALPSTTAFVGAYGDYVAYADQRLYLSWYPALRLAMTMDSSPDAVRAEVAAQDPEALRAACLEGLSSLIPAVTGLRDLGETSRIGGGFIMAVGDTDIDDPASGLHMRHQIGVRAQGRWISLSTGKFCTAPLYGVEAAQSMLAQLS